MPTGMQTGKANMEKMRARARVTQRLVSPILKFAELEASSGILLLICAFIAMIWANSPWAEVHQRIFSGHLTVGYGSWELSKPLVVWINDFLMALFFLVVGLEIKREVLMGQLRSPRSTLLPLGAAVGGMLVPALIYLALNGGKEGVRGWGVPMATDIAFSLGILALLGTRAPLSLKIFLTTLAIADDLGAVLVIAFAYTKSIDFVYLEIAGVLWLILLMTNFMAIRRISIYLIIGLGVWYCFLKSGIHPTIAGVMIALTVPVWVKLDAKDFIDSSRNHLATLKMLEQPTDSGVINEDQQSEIQALEQACEHVQMPLQRLEHILHPWLMFLIVPLFAIANAGVRIEGNMFASILQPIELGVILGLLLGKPIGILLCSWILVKVGLADLPPAVTWRHMTGVSLVAGIGFTMSLFVAFLAFDQNDLLERAKAGILIGSLLSGAAGYALLRTTKAPEPAACK